MTSIEWLIEQLKINNYISEKAHWLIDNAKEIEKKNQDVFAIGFAKWLDNKYYQGKNVNEYHRSIDEYREGKYFTAKELLEIYKKEKGL